MLLTTDTVGGVWHQSLELAEGLARRGVAVLLAAMGDPPGDVQRAQAMRLDGVDLQVRPGRLEWMEASRSDVDAAGAWLLALAEAFGADVVHLNQFAFGRLRFGRPVLVVGHASVTSRWRAVHGTEAPARWDGYRATVSRGLAGADLIGAPTRAMLQSLYDDFGPAAPGIVLPSARKSAFYKARTKEPLIFASGRLWDEAKNLGALDRVAPRVPWPIVVAGPVREAHGQDRRETPLRLLGELPAVGVADWVGRAAICAHPACYGSFGLSVLEAAFAGCALVLGDLPGLRETWGEAAVYVAPDDDVALAASLRRLIDDDARRERLAALARARALAFTPKRMVDAHLLAYRSLCGRRHGAVRCASR